jgi:hypothetical protein
MEKKVHEYIEKAARSWNVIAIGLRLLFIVLVSFLDRRFFGYQNVYERAI